MAIVSDKCTPGKFGRSTYDLNISFFMSVYETETDLLHKGLGMPAFQTTNSGMWLVHVPWGEYGLLTRFLRAYCTASLIQLELRHEAMDACSLPSVSFGQIKTIENYQILFPIVTVSGSDSVTLYNEGHLSLQFMDRTGIPCQCSITCRVMKQL